MLPIPPLIRLRLLGLCCPCLTNETDRSGREACVALSNVPIKWHRQVVRDDDAGSTNSMTPNEKEQRGGSVSDDDNNALRHAGDAARRVLCEGINQIATSLSGESLHLAATNVTIAATLDVTDTADGPAVRITPCRVSPSDKVMYNFVDEDDSPLRGRRRPASRTVLLRDIGTVAAGDGILDSAGAMTGTFVACGIKIRGKQHQMDPTTPISTTPVLLQLDVVETVVHGVTRDEVVRHLNALVLWNRQRIAANIRVAVDTMNVDDEYYYVLEEADRERRRGEERTGGTRSMC